MPDLYKFDNVDKCFAQFGESALYCVVNSFVKQETASDISRLIKSNFKSLKKFLRHDKLQRGLCVDECKQILEKLGDDSEMYFVDQIPLHLQVVENFED